MTRKILAKIDTVQGWSTISTISGGLSLCLFVIYLALKSAG